MTLAESGVRDLLKSGDYQFLDREIMDPEEVYRRTFSADVFLMSANAITRRDSCTMWTATATGWPPDLRP